jgi:uncharacterized MAPEG superfamily protein
MTGELEMLALYGLLVALTLALQATGSFQQLGMGYLLSSRDESRTVGGIAGRLNRALNNSVVAMVLFAPAVLVLHAKGVSTSGTVIAAQLFLAARVIYLPAYAYRITGVRTLAWSVGFVATVALYLMAVATS